MRLFLAINFSQEVINEFKGVLHYWQNSVSAKQLRVVPWQNLHLTLNFLGEINADQLEALGQKVSAVSKDNPEFTLTFLPEIGFLPNSSQPKVIFHKLAANRELSNLAAAVQQATASFSARATLNFRPHVTLARVKSPNLALPAAPWPTISSRCLISTIDLMSSTLTAAGPIYKCLKKYSLAKI
jgi:2'-5' RNA ligase